MDDESDDADELEGEEDVDDAGMQTVVTIEISGLSLYTHVGVTEAEREVGQRLVVGVERTRMTSAARRGDLLAAAASEFAITGLHGTSTEAIAKRAGISHAYVFRFFPTKKALFMACAERCIERTLATFQASV